MPQYRGDIVEQETSKWVQACPSTEGGHNWQAMSYHPGAGLLIIPLSQSCMAMPSGVTNKGSPGTSVLTPVIASTTAAIPGNNTVPPTR